MTNARVLTIGAPPTFRQEVAHSIDAAPELIDWMPSITAAEEVLALEQAPDVIVVSPEVKDFDALGLAEFVLNIAPTTAIVLVRENPPKSLIPAAMRAGIREVVDLAEDGSGLEEAMARALAWATNLRSASNGSSSKSNYRGKVITIFSSKGGTGKTFLSSNVAAAVAERSKIDTAVVDLDIKVGDIFSYFGREPSRPSDDLEALGDKSTRDELIELGSKVDEHLYAFGWLPDPAAEPMPGERAGKMLRAFRSAFAYTIVDASAEYSDQTVAAFDVSDEIWLVTSLDVVGVRHLLIALETLMSLGVPRDRFRILLNRADSKVGLDLGDVERILKVKIDTRIPSSELVPRSLNKGRPVYLQDPRSDVAIAIGELADGVIGSATTQVTNPVPVPVGRRLATRLLGLHH
ncbi:MAG: AAA family ATPase [Actinomycetota bacterium]